MEKKTVVNKFVSIIIPVMNEERQISKTLEVIHSIISKAVSRYIFIIIDDGSSDSTWETIQNLSNIYNIKSIRLSRNFGKEAAICAGLDNSEGEASIIIDADLQHPPHLIPEMINLWSNEGYDIIHGIKTSRGKENVFYKICSNVFYKTMNTLSGINLNNASDFKLLDFNVIEAWKMLDEKVTFFRGMSGWVGFKSIYLSFEVAPRMVGGSKWSLIRLAKLATTAITSFTSLPLQIVTFAGTGLFVTSLILAVQTLFNKISGKAVSGFTTVILLQLIIGSSIMISLGIIGTYIARIFEEVKARPRYIISEKSLSPSNQISFKEN
jgi:polyisoprenyl-phosphate glycosyltransferase